MKKNKKNYLIHTILFFFIIFFISKLSASETINFLSLKNDEVNLRKGPSFEYPIKFTYKKNIYQLLLLINLNHGDKLKILKKIQAGYIFHNYPKKSPQ